MGSEVFACFEDSIIARLTGHQKPESFADDDDYQDTPTHQGKLIVDATVVEQAIRYPTDLSLLNEAREISEQIINTLHPLTGVEKKVRTYRRNARKDYLALVKQGHRPAVALPQT